MNLLFSVHNDDESLFCAYTVMRKRPLVIVPTDSYIQSKRGDAGCDAKTRRAETEAAMRILGTRVLFFGISDDQFTEVDLLAKIKSYGFKPSWSVYAPALQGGNPQHDIVSRVCSEYFSDVTYYATYAKGEHFTPLIGDDVIEVVPTPEEIKLKSQALACYHSQINLPATRPHFEAVRGKYEYLSKRQS